jgi:chitinase
VAASEPSRIKFARSCAAFARKYLFDGIDIDWEFPGGGGKSPAAGGPQDKHNFTLLLRELRHQLDEQSRLDGRTYLLTAAVSASPDKMKFMELDQIQRDVDFINVMAYDFAGPWSAVTGFNAPLFDRAPANSVKPALSGDSAIRAYLAAGFPRNKLVLGVPFYGRGFVGTGAANHGLFQPFDQKQSAQANAGEWPYRNVRARYLDSAAAPRFFDDVAKVPWIYDAKNKLMISYDDSESLRLKAEFVRKNKLGGVMIWELSQDDSTSTLLKALRAGLAAP